VIVDLRNHIGSLSTELLPNACRPFLLRRIYVVYTLRSKNGLQAYTRTYQEMRWRTWTFFTTISHT